MLSKKTKGIIILAVSLMPVFFATFTHGEIVLKNWYKVCNNHDHGTVVCNTMHNNISETGQYLAVVNLIQITGKENEKRISIQVPTGRLISEGITLKVDSGKNKRIPYFVCNSLVCIANDVFDDNLIAAMKKGAMLTVTSFNFQGRENPIPISLQGFSNAFDSPGIQEQDLKKEQEKLQKAFHVKQKEIEERIRAEQEKAKMLP